MPYFKKDNINLLVIHIPKTGGTSVTEYLSKKYAIDLDYRSLYNPYNANIPDFIQERITPRCNDVALQHFTYMNIWNNKDILNVDFDNNLKIIVIVRNPYERIISDLFWQKIIDKDTHPNEVYKKLKEYININKDNHNLPQYLFILDENRKPLTNILILKTETLTDDMIKLGYSDFRTQKKINKNHVKKNTNYYYYYLNKASINLINIVYFKDFYYFNYKQIQIK